jgi:hypothetical protein
MKAWFVGIMVGGFFGFTIASLAFLLELTIYGERDSKPTLVQAVQILVIIILGWAAWKAEGIQALVGYVLGSFYIMRLILLPYKTPKD